MKNTPDIRLRSTDAAQACPGAAQVRGGAAALEPSRGGEPGAHGGHVQQPRVLLQAHREAPRRPELPAPGPEGGGADGELASRRRLRTRMKKWH